MLTMTPRSSRLQLPNERLAALDVRRCSSTRHHPVVEPAPRPSPTCGLCEGHTLAGQPHKRPPSGLADAVGRSWDETASWSVPPREVLVASSGRVRPRVRPGADACHPGSWRGMSRHLPTPDLGPRWSRPLSAGSKKLRGFEGRSSLRPWLPHPPTGQRLGSYSRTAPYSILPRGRRAHGRPSRFPGRPSLPRHWRGGPPRARTLRMRRWPVSCGAGGALGRAAQRQRGARPPHIEATTPPRGSIGHHGGDQRSCCIGPAPMSRCQETFVGSAGMSELRCDHLSRGHRLLEGASTRGRGRPDASPERAVTVARTTSSSTPPPRGRRW